MENIKYKCPKCKSDKIYQYDIKRTHFFQEKSYDVLRNEFGDSADTDDYFITKCKCKNCGQYSEFKVLVEINIIKVNTLSIDTIFKNIEDALSEHKQ